MVDVIHPVVAIHEGPATALVASSPATTSVVRNHTTCTVDPVRMRGTACCGLLSSKEVPWSWDSNGTLCRKIRATTLRWFRA